MESKLCVNCLHLLDRLAHEEGSENHQAVRVLYQDERSIPEHGNGERGLGIGPGRILTPVSGPPSAVSPHKSPGAPGELCSVREACCSLWLICP